MLRPRPEWYNGTHNFAGVMMPKEIEFHPFAAEYPLMPAFELGRLEQAMRQTGFDPRFPIVRYKRAILDGRNRYLAAKAAGVKPLFIDFKGDDEAARRFVITANEERRHLAPEWLARRRKERVERVAAARAEGKSLRTIAEAEGVSAKTIHQDLEKATVTGVTVDPPNGQVTGKDGRTRTATPKRTEPEEPSEPPAETDSAGVALPGQAKPAFALAGDMASLCRTIDSSVAEVERLGKSPAGVHLHYQSVQTHLKNAKSGLWAARPRHVCPYCRGEKTSCKVCKGQGWVTDAIFRAAPKE